MSAKKRGSSHRVAAFLSTLECVLGKQPLQIDVIMQARPTTATSDAIQPNLLIITLIICVLFIWSNTCWLSHVHQVCSSACGRLMGLCRKWWPWWLFFYQSALKTKWPVGQHTELWDGNVISVCKVTVTISSWCHLVPKLFVCQSDQLSLGRTCLLWSWKKGGGGLSTWLSWKGWHSKNEEDWPAGPDRCLLERFW